jgi:hypothetical protein
VRDFTDEDITFKPAIGKLAYIAENPAKSVTLTRAAKMKTSLHYKKVIDRYLDGILAKLLPEDDFTLDGRVLYKARRAYEAA